MFYVKTMSKLGHLTVSDDLFCVSKPGTYFEVLTPYKVIKFIQSTSSKATFKELFSRHKYKMLIARFGFFMQAIWVS
jgi:hypothetical protein